MTRKKMNKPSFIDYITFTSKYSRHDSSYLMFCFYLSFNRKKNPQINVGCLFDYVTLKLMTNFE